jgi:predicted aconitase
MGTQQILLILLSVIIVGIAISVGITVFNQQSINSSRNEIVAHMHQLCAQSHSYWKLPTSMGGAGYDTANLTTTKLVEWFGDQLANEMANYFFSLDVSNLQISFGCNPYEKGIVNGKAPILTLDLSSGLVAANMTGDIQTGNGF